MDNKTSLLFDDAEQPKDQHKPTSTRPESPIPPVLNKPVVSQQLKLKWPVGHSMRYAVIFEMFLEERRHQIKYEIQVQRLENSPDNQNCFSIDRDQKLYVNEMEPDLMADQLALEVSTVLYPMVVLINSQGTFTEVQNVKEIRNRWKDLKPELNRKYEGEVFDDYLSIMDNCIQDDFLLNTAIQDQEWFLNVFFQAIYKDYTVNNKADLELYFPILPFKNMFYSSKYTLQEELSDLGMIEIRGVGNIVPEEGETEPTGTYHAAYSLHPYSKQIWFIRSNWLFEQYNKVKFMKFELFGIEENGKDLNFDFFQQENPKLEIMEADSNVKKESIWKRLTKM